MRKQSIKNFLVLTIITFVTFVSFIKCDAAAIGQGATPTKTPIGSGAEPAGKGHPTGPGPVEKSHHSSSSSSTTTTTHSGFYGILIYEPAQGEDVSYFYIIVMSPITSIIGLILGITMIVFGVLGVMSAGGVGSA
ncbi:hypothetical protein NEMIN01_2268 [Nematocida minor]|uniref:uncharacterized protein n=1 Tax=Nematocida minor TaxID=1912983 RepID=UPI0022207AA3|nr:uncharacterized protein NEMIN01_2268 [Nematocida minor]KAI5192888.1 hypothetical protein NEMIN01_2268 [Nematocida minor]